MSECKSQTELVIKNWRGE